MFGGWVLYIQNKRTVRLESVGDSRVSRYDFLVSGSGTLSPVNYENNEFYTVDIKCNLRNKTCRFASVGGGQAGHFHINQDYHEITYSDNTQVIVENNDPSCRKEIWKIDLISKSLFLDSYPKDLKDQVGDCSYMERKILTSKFVSFYDRRLELEKKK